MGTQANASAEAISLPKGGGAIQGIGETFSPDLHTGTGNFSIPLTLPPGRGGLAPELALSYSTGAGNGPFGLGWSLGVPMISRKTSRGVPRYRDADPDPRRHDTFLLAGAEDLVPVPGAPEGAQRYRPRTEGLFAEIDRRSAGNDWVVRTTDGRVSRYGGVQADGSTAAVADPDDPSRVFAWMLTETQDACGNRIRYEYERDRGEEGAHRWDQLYLRRVLYNDYLHEGETRWLVSVELRYATRPDPFSDRRPGFEVRTRRRCTQVVVRTHADRERLVRTYTMNYLDERPELAFFHARNGVSLLSRIEVAGFKGPVRETLPPLELGYTRFEPEGRRFFSLRGRDLPARSLAGGSLELVDLFGSGLPDFLEMDGGPVRFWRNLGDGTFDLPRSMAYAPAGLRLGEPGVRLVDANGDGRTDLLVSTATQTGFYPLARDGGWDRGSFRAYRAAPSFDLADPEVRLVDLDGDGITDAIRAGATPQCFFQDPEEGWTGARTLSPGALAGLPVLSFADERVHWADMTGDGLQDLVMVHAGRVDYWPSLGHGSWGVPVRMTEAPRLPHGHDPARVLLGDVDGDGVADLVYVDHGSVTIWLNRSGNGWSAPVEIHGTPLVADLDDVRLADLLGNGVPGVLWSADVSPGRQGGMRFLDLTGGVKPYLLREMDNRTGTVTRLAYAPSTRFYLADRENPATRWRTPLPFPVHVVARAEVLDAVSGGKRTTEYAYHHGYWDGEEREFHGFGRVDTRDTESFTDHNAAGLHGDRSFTPVPERVFSPPVERRTWFHPGAVEDGAGGWGENDLSGEHWAEPWPGTPGAALLPRPAWVSSLLAGLPPRDRRDALRALRGRVVRTELYARDGSEREGLPYTVAESLYGLREEQPPAAGDARRRIFFPHLLAERTTEWERGNDPMTRVTFTDLYDRFGQPRSRVAVAVPRGRDPRAEEEWAEPYLATHEVTIYALPAEDGRLIAGCVAHATTWELAGVRDGSVHTLRERALLRDPAAPRRVLAQTLHHYDGEAFEGLPLGQVGPRGAAVRTETLVLTPEGVAEAYGEQLPPWLADDPAAADWSAYPAEFRERLAPGAGYVRRHAAEGSPVVDGWFAVTGREYDFQRFPTGWRGLVMRERDPMGRETETWYDRYLLLPRLVRNAAGLATDANYDYRTLKPRRVRGPNGNRSFVRYTALGQVAETALAGKVGETVGDPDGGASTLFTYDLRAFHERGVPVSVTTVRRIYHETDPDADAAERGRTVRSVEYSDGFGRVVQTRTQAAETAFGEERFGGEVLSANPAEVPGDAVGRSASGAPRVVVSGLQLFDNKGRAVESYEPFFGRGYDYLPAGEADRGRRVLHFYDPRGEVVRTVHPDGSEERLVRGVPAAPEDPDHFTPTPWESWRYDANDNVARSHPDATAAWIARHRDTPASVTVDAMGHPVLAVSRTRAGAGAALEEHRTRSVFDVSGNVLAVLDPLGRVARRAAYDLAGRPLRIRSLDAGEATTFLNVAGGPLETRDAKGARTLRACDLLGRPVRMWASDAAGAALTLRERVEYGDGGDPAQPPAEREAARAANRLGHPARHFDEAGVVVFEQYDFRGRPAEKTRRVIAETRLLETIAAAAADAWRLRPLAVDWTPPAATGFEAHAAALLGAREYRTSSAYDALGRARWVRAPADAAGARAEIRPAYNAGGQMERVRVDGTVYVEHVAYNASGQRTLVAYGNGVMTRHAYHPRSARLVRSRTERYAVPAGSPFTFRPAPAAGQAHPLQDLAYGYDLNGNVLRITDRTPGCGVRANPDAATWQEQDPALAALLAAGDALVRRFEYDPLGRLETATGREAGGATAPRPWADAPAFGFGSGAHATPTQDNAAALSALYRETYAYDPAGNLVSLRHEAGGGAWTRHFGMDGSTPADWAALWPQHLGGALWTGAPSNRMTHAGDDLPGAARTHLYDSAGNLLRQNEDRHLAWDHANRLRLFRVQTPASGSAAGDDLWAEPSVCAHYLYDAGGQRVLKLVRKQGGAWEATVYVDGAWEHQRWTLGSGATGECVVQHVMDGPRRIALARTGDRHPDDGGPAVQYHLGDHLGSSTLVTDAAGGWANREEFTPFGESVFGSFARKRYRFTGMERDGESGLGYHGARYYAPWLCRWASADPAGLVDGTNLYAYCRGNPLRFSDPSGTTGLEAAAAAAVSTGAPVSGTAVTGAAGGALSGGAAAGGTGVAASSGAGAVATSTFQGYVGAGAAAEATAVVETGASATTWGMRALAVLETGSAAAAAGLVAVLIPGNLFDPIGTGAPVREPVSEGELPMSLPGQSGPAVQEPAASGPAVSEPAPAQAPVCEPAQADSEMWAGRPNTARRNEHNYGGWYLDPFTNKAVTGYPEVTPADHIVPEDMIRKMPGFSKLTPEQQREVMNYQGNFQPLPKWLNSSKGAKTYMEWTEAPSKPGDPSSVKPFHPDYIKDMQLLTIQIMAELSAMVDYFRYGR